MSPKAMYISRQITDAFTYAAFGWVHTTYNMQYAYRFLNQCSFCLLKTAYLSIAVSLTYPRCKSLSRQIKKPAGNPVLNYHQRFNHNCVDRAGESSGSTA